ncbi:MAG: ATP-binding protein, partial [Pseudomonadota bacterium]
EKTLEQLPQRFWRASKEQGSGLGLAIVAAIAERFGGRLAFHNDQDGGLVAEFVVPASLLAAGE